MLRRNASDTSVKSQKIPIRSARSSKPDPMLGADRILRRKYLQVSIGAFHFRHVQNYLEDRNHARELQILAEGNTYIQRFMSFKQTKDIIKGVITERVEKDYLFGITFHSPFFTLLEKYQRQHRRLKQRNLYNRYYFSSCPPKISLITQPTATTLRAPESNSTIELQALTKNLEAMLQVKPTGSCKKLPISATPEKRLKDKSEKSRKALRINRGEEVQQQNYGLKNYRKGTKLRLKGTSRQKQPLFVSIKYCITPQPHASKQKDMLFSSPSQGRLSERKGGASRSGEKRRKF